MFLRGTQRQNEQEKTLTNLMDKLHILLLLFLKILSASIYLCDGLVALWDDEFPGSEKITITLL